MPDADVLALLLLAALAAGWVDAVAGGGGLIQLPALLVAFPGAPPLAILATNKLAAVWGTTAAALQYARRLPRRPRVLALLLPAAGAGSVAGALLAGLVPAGVFVPAAAVVLVAVAVLVVALPRMGTAGPRGAAAGDGVPRSVAAVGGGVGVWDGLFGPGTGTLLTVGLAGWSGYAFLDAAGLARAANVVTNLTAIAVFALTYASRGEPVPVSVWGVGLAMGAVNLVGGWLGARTALARGSRFVRVVLVVVVCALAVRLLWPLMAG